MLLKKIKSLKSSKFGKFSLLMIITLSLLFSTIFFSGCSKKDDPDDWDLLTGTVWISEFDLAGYINSKGVYSFSTSTTGTWKRTLWGVTVPFTTLDFKYTYSKTKITITYDNFFAGDKETGTVKGNTMVLTKDNGTVINYKKE